MVAGEDTRRTGIVQAVERALNILDLLGTRERTVTELARELGVDKSTSSRLLSTLRARSYVERGSADGSFRLGPRVGALGYQYVALLHPGSDTSPILDRIAASLGDAVSLNVYDGERIVCVDKREGTQPLRASCRVGWSQPLHVGAASRAVLAYLPQDEVRQFLAKGPLERFSEHTITDPDALLADLELIRQRGYAVSMEEVDEGVVGAGIPLLDWNGWPVASIGVIAPMIRFTPARLAEIVEALHEAGQAWERGPRRLPARG